MALFEGRYYLVLLTALQNSWKWNLPYLQIPFAWCTHLRCTPPHPICTPRHLHGVLQFPFRYMQKRYACVAFGQKVSLQCIHRKHICKWKFILQADWYVEHNMPRGLPIGRKNCIKASLVFSESHTLMHKGRENVWDGWAIKKLFATC